ncbi:hypothetical protein [Arthrobacter sp. zg-Y1110]|uniref:zinc finger domain-containing protein n=1 Tax=Arthrobacter sp. zg-Y1110 TaxID=2886932 RepID=UPI001D1516FF|nr:hypothetical protein [Arthrobacter sp. zg-Y1110]MCC3292483.1 hypothetical protein [Arthrobacter sp. zg-Y1110]UWX87085.1 hypothetical protein N2K99_17180 [Arthrobacter sp. zg-Y1110]
MSQDIDQSPEPLNFFDPSGGGRQPRTLAQLVAAGEAAVAAVKAYRSAMYDCMTPLNLLRENTEAKAAATALEMQVREIAQAQEAIESDAPLARRLEDSDPWAARDTVVLSPRQINALAARGRVARATASTYRQVLSKAAGEALVPPLIAMDRESSASSDSRGASAETAAARNAERDRMVLEILTEMESVECETCSVQPGLPCLTASGYVAERPHAPRFRSSPLAQANREESWLATRRKADGWAPAPLAEYQGPLPRLSDGVPRSAAAQSEALRRQRTVPGRTER